jgi:DNA-binding NarL/FixJ family response regulator
VTAALRLVVVDDHPVFRLGMVSLLASLGGIDVVGEAADADEAVRVVLDAGPDVVIMDLDLGDTSGIDATRDVVAARPEVGVLVVTMLDDDDSVFAAMRAGARGYLLKGASPDEIERAVHAVANGEVLISGAIAARALAFVAGSRRFAAAATSPFPELTDREHEVLELVAGGHDNATIARRLGLSPKTVRNHLSNVLTKLQVTDRAQAIVRARQAGLGDTPPSSSEKWRDAPPRF